MSSSRMRRPKPGEDDLEEMMKEFDKQNIQPAASLVNLKKPKLEEPEEPKKKSLFAKRREAENGDLKNDNQISKQSDVLSEIIEKNIMEAQLFIKPPTLPTNHHSGQNFPEYKKIDVSSLNAQKTGKKSLFAKQFKKMKQEIKEVNVSDNSVNIASFGDSSRLITGSGLEKEEDSVRIHEENLAILNQMSNEEILKEKEKFTKQLDPKLLEFLRKKSNIRNADPNDYKKESEVTGVLEEVKTKIDAPINHGEKVSGYPNMNNVEADKMKWMGELPDISKNKKIVGLTARFGFDGRLLHPDSDVPVHAGLHHHGEDQEHPGYSIEEMMILARSSNNRQKQMGLELLEAVLCVWWSGELDINVNQNIVEVMVSAGLVQLIRVCHDSSEEGLVIAAAKCLVSLLCCSEEERLLDWLVDMRQPDLSPESKIELEDGDTEENITDHHVVVQDVVLGLMRMDILDRYHYLLTVKKYSDKALISGILAVITRLSRHSVSVAVRVSRHRIMTHMVTHHWSHPLCVKLVRVICSWDVQLATELVTNLNLESQLIKQLASGAESLYQTQTSVECHKLWSVLLSWNQLETGLNIWTQLYPVTMSRLMELHNTDQLSAPSCVGSWLITVSCHVLIRSSGISSDLVMLLENCVTKWLAQMTRIEQEDDLSPTFLQLVSVTCQTLAQYYCSESGRDNATIERLKNFYLNTLEKFMCSKIYISSLNSLPSNCCYLNENVITSRHPSCLPSVGVILHGGHPHPLLTHESKELFLSGFLSLVSTVKYFTSCSFTNSGYDIVVKLFKNLAEKTSLSLVSHWLSRVPSILLYNLLMLYESKIPFELQIQSALRISSVFHKSDRRKLVTVFEKYLFNKNILKELPDTSVSCQLPSPSGLVENPKKIIQSSLQKMNQLSESYIQLLNISNAQSKDNTNSPISIHSCTLLTLDWPYFPLLSLYNSSVSGQGQTSSPVTHEMMLHTLIWLSLMPLTSSLTSTWVQLATVCLCKDSLILSPDISCMLHINLVKILSKGNLDMSQSVPGVSSNLDFFGQLVDQFISESYSDLLFSLFVVLPIQMNQPLTFRKMLWTEKTEYLRLIRISTEHVSPCHVSQWTSPPETDVSVLMSMYQNLVQGEISQKMTPLLHHVAVVHLQLLVSNTKSISDKELEKFRNFLLKEISENSSIQQMIMS